MKQQNRFDSQGQAQEQNSSPHQAQQQPGLEFATVEEMLRHDALHTPVPPSIACRLQETIQKSSPPPPASWWRRLFGGSSR